MEHANSSSIVYDTDHVYLILGMFRPGAVTFMTRMEYEYFFPTNPTLNDLYSVNMHKFDGQTYVVIGFPRQYLEQAKKLAKKLSLRLLSGVPTSIDSNKHPVHFPIESASDSTYTITNQSTYTLEQAQQVIRLEVQEIRKYLSKHRL